MKKVKIYWLIFLILLGLTVLVNGLAFIKPIVNMYADVVYPYLVASLGALNNWSPVALGEIGVILAAVIVFVEIIISILLIFLRKKGGYKKFAQIYSKSLLMILVCGLFLFSITWLVPIRADKADTQNASGREYTFSDIETLRNFIVIKTDYLAMSVERDEKGRLIYEEDVDSKIIEAMKLQSERYPRLKGLYGRPKYAICSDFLEWSGIGGFTFTFPKEVMLNKYTSRFYFPSLYSHELAHYKGYFLESDANFISYITMDESEDLFLAYTANAQMLFQYVEDAYEQAIWEVYDIDTEYDKAVAHYLEQAPILSVVVDDMTESYEESQELYESSEHPAEAVSETVSEVSDYGWEAQDAVLKEDNYDGVVRMLLEYYDGILY